MSQCMQTFPDAVPLKNASAAIYEKGQLTVPQSLCNAGQAIVFAWLADNTWKTQQIRV